MTRAIVIAAIFVLIVLDLALAAMLAGAKAAGEPWYQGLKDFQDGLAALVGFGGLIIAATVGFAGGRHQIAANAAEAERQHRREQDAEALRIAVQLSGEIIAIRGRATALSDRFSKCADEPSEERRRDRFIMVLESSPEALPTSEMYERVKDQVGVLGSGLGERVVKYYSLVQNDRRVITRINRPDKMLKMSDDQIRSMIRHVGAILVELAKRAELLHAELRKFADAIETASKADSAS